MAKIYVYSLNLLFGFKSIFYELKVLKWSRKNKLSDQTYILTFKLIIIQIIH